jgi:3-hydroxyacyl-[acyl-carrier-protein] dehydratase
MGNTTTLTISPQHPAFNGHFPGAPLLPGVVLLDEILRAVQNAAVLSGQGERGRRWTISAAKFLHPVRPGETLTLEHEPLANGAVRFAIHSAGRQVAGGTLVPRLQPSEPDVGHQAG